MKWVAFAFFAAALMVNGQESQPHSNTVKRDSAAHSKNATDAASQPMVVINQQTPQRQEDSHSGNPPSYLSRLFNPENLPNVALVVIGIGAIIVAFQSLKRIDKQIAEMRRQVDLTFGQLRAMHEQITEMSKQTDVLERSVYVAEDSAGAALLNAKAVIAAERPWIVVKIERIEAEQRQDIARPFWKFTMFNCGRSPAHIVSCRHWIGVMPIDKLAIPPQYPSAPWSKTLIAPNESFQILIPFQASEMKMDAVKDAALRAWEKGQTTLGERGEMVVYGLIQYTDGIAQDTYRTAFCYKHVRGPMSSMGGSFETCGPTIYNEYT
jgi:hypothetical protein